MLKGELRQKGIQVYVATEGDNLVTILKKIDYTNSDEDIRKLMVLNHVPDWYCIPPGINIKYSPNDRS